jgi:hypothetical protein
MDPDPESLKTYGSYKSRSGSATLVSAATAAVLMLERLLQFLVVIMDIFVAIDDVLMLKLLIKFIVDIFVGIASVTKFQFWLFLLLFRCCVQLLLFCKTSSLSYFCCRFCSFDDKYCKLVGFGLPCAPVRCGHPSFWTHCDAQRGATRPPPIAASLLP